MKFISSNKRFENLSFDDFKMLACDQSLTQYERIGFPDSYRKGFEEKIFADIVGKLTNLISRKKRVLDIGPGCSDLPKLLINNCQDNDHILWLIDSKEMLTHLPDLSFINKIPGFYPTECSNFIDSMRGTLDVIICYSVLHYILIDTAFFRFLDNSLSLLAPNGQLLIGDIPNISKRKRFFSSETGVRFHQEFMQTTERPVVEFNRIEQDQIDDAVVFAILQRARIAGFDAYVLPQNPALPMANRREDILIICP